MWPLAIVTILIGSCASFKVLILSFLKINCLKLACQIAVEVVIEDAVRTLAKLIVCYRIQVWSTLDYYGITGRSVGELSRVHRPVKVFELQRCLDS